MGKKIPELPAIASVADEDLLIAEDISATSTGKISLAQVASLARQNMVTADDLADHAGLSTTAHGGIVSTGDARLTDARTPLAHKTSHATGGSDALTAADIGAAAAAHTHAVADITDYVPGGGTSDAVPAGGVLPFAMASAPEGWLKCNGAAVSRTTYAALFAALGTTFGAGDGSTTFNLPDLRGEFVRGWDDGRGVDAGRTRGTVQADMVGPHSHILDYTLGAIAGTTANVPTGAGYGLTYTTRATTTSETRPRNVALLYCVKY